MAYYDQLIAAWNNPIQPPTGVAGSGLASSDSTQDKLDKINAWTVTGAVPTDFTVNAIDLFNCITWTEFNSGLQAAQKTNLLGVLAVPGAMLFGPDNSSKLAWGMMAAYFPANGPTMTAVKALAKSKTAFWCEVYGYPLNATLTAGGLTLNDANNAGLV